MSGKKLSDVTNSISTHTLSCESEVNAAETKITSMPKRKRIKPSAKFDKGLINTYFPDAFDKQIQLRQNLQEQYETKHESAASLIKEIKKLRSAPKSILKDLQKLHDKVLKSGRVHNMDSEFTDAENLGNKLHQWKVNMRELTNRLEHIQFSGTSIEEIYQSITLIDNQLVDMEQESTKLHKAEQVKKQRAELFKDCESKIKSIDKSFVNAFMSPEEPVLQNLESIVNNPKSSIRQLKQALSKLSGFSTQVSNKRKAMEVEKSSLESTIDEISKSLESLKALDPVCREMVSATSFYQSYGKGKIADIQSVTERLSEAVKLLSNFELITAREIIAEQRIKINDIRDILRDDTNIATALVDQALIIRDTLTGKGLGDGNLEISVDQLLDKGILIKTIAPKNTYFQINANGSLEANVDSISTSCVKGMADFINALASNGLIVNPKNWKEPQQSKINHSSEDPENLNKTS